MQRLDLQNNDPYRVGFLLVDGFSLLTYSSATEPLRAANRLTGKDLYEIWNIPAQGARATASCGAIVPTNAHVGERLGFDLVLVVASEDGPQAREPRLLDWLRQLARRKIALGGVAAGPLMLARAGLLKQHKMTLHWSFEASLKETQPELVVQSSLFVIDRDRVTCAGGTAAMDLMHDVIRQQHGKELATQVSDWFSHVDVRSSEAPQRAGLEARYGALNAVIAEAIKLMENHFGDPLELGQLAAGVGVSERQLNRLFKEKLSNRTMDFYRRLRLQHGLLLLQQTALPVSEIVLATGFASASHFSRAFKDVYGLTPTQARETQDEWPNLMDSHWLG